MRYVFLPEPVELPITVDDKGTLLRYSCERYFFENVWPHEIWRDSQANQAAYFRLYAIFTEAFKGNYIYVAMSDEDCELLLPIVTQKGIKLRPELVQPLQMIMKPFFEASPKKPDVEQARPLQ